MPKRKIFDITPPEDFKKEKFLPEEDKLLETKPFLSFSFKKILIILLIFLTGVAVYCYFFIEPKAEIEIWPETEFLELETQLELSSSINEPDFSAHLIPVFPFKVEKTLSQEFPSSGTTTLEKKAKGIIRVYNKYYLPVTLIKGTRFISSSEPVKQFLTQQKITIPAKGYIDTEVIAAEAGEDYNIEACTFSVPGLRKFSPPQLYYDVYGKSSSPMAGGVIVKTPQITQKDLDRAKEVLIERIFEESKKSLKSDVPKEFIIIDETINQEVTELSPFGKAGQELETFVFELKAKTESLIFKNSDLKNFARHYVLTQIPQNKGLCQGTLKIDYSPQTVNIKQKKVILDLKISAEIYSTPDFDVLKEVIKGESIDEVSKIILKNYSEVSNIKLKLKPFWQKSIPLNSKNIKIKLNF